MAETILAAVLTDDRRVGVREFLRPAIGADDGLLCLETRGLRGSDVGRFHGELRGLDLTYRLSRRRAARRHRGGPRRPSPLCRGPR